MTCDNTVATEPREAHQLKDVSRAREPHRVEPRVRHKWIPQPFPPQPSLDKNKSAS